MAMQKRGLPIVKPYISPLTVSQTVRFQILCLIDRTTRAGLPGSFSHCWKVV